MPQDATPQSTLGLLERRADGRYQLRFERRLAHPVDKVWRAITEREHLRAWFPGDLEGERVAGARLRFLHEGPPIDGQMIVFDPPSVMELRWGDNEVLRFELRRDGYGTRLTFLNVFDQVGKAARDAAGWHACLDALAYHLDAQAPPWTPQALSLIHI